MIRSTVRSLFLQVLIIGIIATVAHAEYIDDFKKHAKSIYLLHSVKHITPAKQAVEPASDKRKVLMSHGKSDSKHMDMLSYIPAQSFLLPMDDIKTIVSNIERLTKKNETTQEGEEAQRIKFDMAYEYFLLYLHFLNEKYGLTRPGQLTMIDEIPIKDKELEQYLYLSEYYLKSFINSSSGSSDMIIQGKTLLKATDDVSFKFRNIPDLYLNVYFLSMMLECEKLAGEWGDISQSRDLSNLYDKKTWSWLDTLWKSRFMTNRGPGVYAPSSKTMFSLYELYMRYHFFGRYIRNLNEKDPLLDSQTRTLLNRLSILQKETGIGQTGFYEHYSSEATKDSNNTNFIVSLYLARRGFVVTRDLNFSLPKNELFELYRKFYDDAGKNVKYNIPYRSIIYNELILFGVGIDNLRLMEDVLYQYGQLSMRLQENENSSGGSIKNSSRLTMAYLLANILDKKRRSGLDQNSDQYSDIAETLTPLLVSKDTNYWEYASVIHSALAMFYSRKESSESLAMYHARRSFMAPCEKTALTYGSEANGWMNFFKLTGAESYLKLYTEFQKKYQTSPDAAIPKEFNAHLILKRYQETKK